MAWLLYIAFVIFGFIFGAAAGIVLPVLCAKLLVLYSGDSGDNSFAVIMLMACPAGALAGAYYGYQAAKAWLLSKQGLEYWVHDGLWPYGVALSVGFFCCAFLCYTWTR